jgi:putative ABC transport system ATP-binding protein
LQPLIEVNDLHKTFKTEAGSVDILKGISFEVQPKEFAILYGPSGSGKSTLLHHIVGLETPSFGSVKIGDVAISKLNQEERSIFRAQHFGMVYQLWYWIKSLNVWENVAIPLLIQGMPEKEAKKKALEALERISMEKYANKRPAQLSGGEQQRVGMARALVNDPVILVADEPTGNLDTHTSDHVMGILQDLNVNHGRTIVMVTHNLIYLPMASKVVHIQDGKIVEEPVPQAPKQSGIIPGKVS